MVSEDTYRTISSVSTGIYREKASKFLAFAYPVQTEEDVRDILRQVKKEYFDANHHCFAYLLGWDKSLHRVSDDGEPSGTAGRPILGQIQSFDLTNILVVVVRYFGGTKLGASGLIQAYRQSAREALSIARIDERTVNVHYKLTFPYEQMNAVMRLIKEKGLHVHQTLFGISNELLFSVRHRDHEYIYGVFEKLPGIAIEYLKTE